MFKERRPYLMFKKRENSMELLWRYRGVVLVLIIPIFVVMFIMRAPSLTASVTGISENVKRGEERFAVVFDAGSTGSRVHVFKFVQQDHNLRLLGDTFEQLRPGLGDAGWAADPVRSADSLRPLLDKAIEAVPKDQQRETTVELRATAGLRLLPGKQASDILDAVKELLSASPFVLIDDGVSIMDGADEGAYAWMALNYLLGKTGKSAEEQVGVIDLGGGSVQQAFAVEDTVVETAPKSPPPGYIRTMHGAGKKYNVYVHSYLGFGLMQGRSAVLAEPAARACLNAGTSGSYKSPYGDKEIQLQPNPSGGDLLQCASAVDATLKKTKPCGGEKEMCTFDGVWGAVPQHKSGKFYVMSYFFDRALDVGIISDHNTKHVTLTPKHFSTAASRVCAMDKEEVLHEFGGSVDAEQAPFLCLDLAFQYVLLTSGLKIKPDDKMTLVRQVKYNREYFEAAWGLGAAINTLASRS